ncbi:hypothetical protein MRB53_032381 [Persea americana]|uniref:Uncharacterized protein n=1 Tax=Persea americana TaxID=3435 RepID=A0ACC2KRR9_PERAE|nr:hypothetical protein MRB53_032381 [Persea americana]
MLTTENSASQAISKMFCIYIWGSLGTYVVGSYSYLEGRFRALKGDFTRADVRLDISSLVSPKINLAFQKQIIAMILFRLDSRFSPLKEYPDYIHIITILFLVLQIIAMILFRLDSRFSPLKEYPAHLEDVAVGVSYWLWKLQSGKVLFWYILRRREAMIVIHFEVQLST